MGLFDHFPYTNFHELNLDWMLNALRELEHTIDQFVAINALKYADPIQWNITTQYEKNTIVIDPLTGTAYISVQAVPSGVALTRDEYWTEVFDLGQFVVRAAQNFTDRWESQWTLTATFPSTAGDWLVWNDTLYKALTNITAGDQYVINSNIRHFTMEETIGHLEQLQTQGKDSIVQAVNECVNAINTNKTNIGTLSNLSTQTKTNLVAAINEIVNEVNNINNKIGNLNNLSTQTKTNLVAAINEIVNEIVNTIAPSINQIRVDVGDKTQLQTPHKDNLVEAINDLVSTAGDDTFDQSHVISTAIFFGDSITAGDLGNGTIANPTFPQSYGNISGITTTNMGRGGSTAANTPGAGSAEHLNYVASLVNFANYDQCFVCHGVNDYNANSPLGGINSTDETTFMGALQKFVETALSQNPKIQIILLGTFWSSHSHVVNNQFVDYLPANKAGNTIADYINATRNVANKYGLPFIDMCDIMGVNSKNYQYFTIDGIHPLQASYTMIGILLAKSLTFPQADGYEQQIAAAKTCNNNMVCIGDIDQKVGDFPYRYMKRGLTTMFNVNNSYYTSSRRPYTIVSGEPIAFHAIAYVSSGSNFYIRLTQPGTSNTCVLWAYQNQSVDPVCFEVNTVACPNFTGDCVIEAQIAALDGTLDNEIVYLTDIVINKGIIPDRGGLGAYTNEYTWFIPENLATGVTQNNTNPCQYMIDRNGTVQFRGRLQISTSLAQAIIATIPVAFRPQRTVTIPIAKVSSLDNDFISIDSSGNIYLGEYQVAGSIAANHTIDLTNVTYNINQGSDITTPY